MGGAINYLSEAGSTENMVNNFDLGRQLQTSLYSGPLYYVVNGKQPVDQWKYLGWNPVQTGDYYNHPARVLSYQQSQNQLYVKTTPLIWPLFDEPADCQMEHWIELRDNTVHVRCRFVVNRSDTTQYEARTQESPCVYLNGPYYRFVTYTGMKPFTNDALLEYTQRDMTGQYATENWVAMLNDKGRGVGLYKPNKFRYRTAGFGTPKTGNEFDINSSYINSDEFLVIDHNGQYEFEYTLVVGAITDIRQFAYAQSRPQAGPNFRFEQDRQDWYFYNTRDKGWPIQNEMNIRWSRADTTKALFRIMSPMVFWKATDVSKLYIQAAFRTKATTARLVWRKPEDYDFFDIPSRTIEFPITGDGQVRTYEINLNGQTGWDGIINQISLTNSPGQNSGEKGAILQLKSVTTTRPNG